MSDAIAVIVACAIIALVGYGLYKFFLLEKKRRIEIVSEWLLLAVTQAEKSFGDGTGQIKLRYVYDMFLSKFKIVSNFISFEQFSILVDIALEEMNHLIESNQAIKDYVNK